MCPHKIEGLRVVIWAQPLSLPTAAEHPIQRHAIGGVGHHHMLHTVHSVTGPMLWANLHLLFWLSLIPFTTGWMGENHFAPVPVAVYGVVLLMAAIAYWILQRLIVKAQGPDSLLRKAIGSDWKGRLSPLLYALAIVLAVPQRGIAIGLYVLVALLWLVPDRRIERVLPREPD